ncbi:MAG: hypothetical protein ACFFC3_03690 [Candidatus Odinarchaeota archaeon]
MYVKCTQKTKRYLRCKHSHVVSEIEIMGEIVYGMTQAVKLVKKKQNELGIKELGSTSQFSSFKDFRVYPPLQEKGEPIVVCDIENEYLLSFYVFFFKYSKKIII